MKIAIRDDDLCFYSSLDEFKKAYEGIDAPISVSVVPWGVPTHLGINPYGKVEKSENSSINRNEKLVAYFVDEIKKEKCEIMLHGFTHEYKRRGKNYLAEMEWRSKKEMCEMFQNALQLLEKTFECKISTFISPSDRSKKSLFPLLKKYNLNYCGLIRNLFDRPFSLRMLINLNHRWHRRLKYGYPYCGVLKYKGWKEIQAYQKINFNYLKRAYLINKQLGNDMVLELHYWQLNLNPNLKDNLKQFIEFSKKNGASYCLVKDIFYE